MRSKLFSDKSQELGMTKKEEHKGSEKMKYGLEASEMVSYL